MINTNNIIQDGHPTLRKIAKDVEIPLSNENLKIALDLMEYLNNSQDEEISQKYNLREGVGLAAPQIDKQLRMFAIKFDDGNEYLEEIFINPKIYYFCILGGLLVIQGSSRNARLKNNLNRN